MIEEIQLAPTTTRRRSSGFHETREENSPQKEEEKRSVVNLVLPKQSLGYEYLTNMNPQIERKENCERKEKDTRAKNNCIDTSGRNDYFGVWKRYIYYQFYFFSHLCQNMGDWFVRIASLLLVTELADKEGTGLANLVLANILPKSIFTYVGGILADNYDRRNVMIVLDILSSAITLGFVLAIHQKSLPLLYLVTALRAACGAMYYPVTTSIMRMLVPQKHDLLLANTMNSWTWSTMAMIGGLLAGSLAATIGLSTCYIIDSCTFIISAVLLMQIRGNYSVSEQQESQAYSAAINITTVDDIEDVAPQVTKNENSNNKQSFIQSVKSTGFYVWTCGFGVLTLLKATAALIWGAEDIISTAFAETNSTTESEESIRMGLTFTLIGTGCFIGPGISNFLTNADQSQSLVKVCLGGFCLQFLSWLGMSQAHNFIVFLVFTLVRATGSSIIWVNSTLLLQTLTVPQQLGRMLALEYFTYTISESIAATSAGHLEDAGANKNQIAAISAAISAIAIILWAILLRRKDFSLLSSNIQ